MTDSRDALMAVVVVAGFVLGLLLYFAPTIIALVREHPNVASIAVVNICLGWTLVGFVVALAWSFLAIDRERFPSRQSRYRQRTWSADSPKPADPDNPFDFTG